MSAEDASSPHVRPTNLTTEEALELIVKYLPKEWKNLKPEEVQVLRLQTGYNNQVYVVSNNKTTKEPKKVVIRKYGGNAVTGKRSLRPLSSTEELILVCELGRRNLAPKLLGFFDDGRIEEFIDSHQMTEKEAVSPEIEMDLAKNLARFHAVNNVPFPKPGYDFRDVLRGHYRAEAATIAKILGNQDLSVLHAILKYDWETELDWLAPLIDPKRHRMVLMHWDTHLQNIGVRNTRSSNDGGLRTILYDYEMSCYNMRGKDIGLFIQSRIGLIGSTELKMPDQPIDFPSPQECKQFVTEYMKECKGLFDDWDETSMDSFDHIMMESIVGSMVSAVCFLFACARSHETFLKISPDFLIGIILRLNDSYFACKKRLQEYYPNYEKEL